MRISGHRFGVLLSEFAPAQISVVEDVSIANAAFALDPPGASCEVVSSGHAPFLEPSRVRALPLDGLLHSEIAAATAKRGAEASEAPAHRVAVVHRAAAPEVADIRAVAEAMAPLLRACRTCASPGATSNWTAEHAERIFQRLASPGVPAAPTSVYI